METILVCDDDREIVEAIDIYLTQEGYRVLKAYDGIEALEILKNIRGLRTERKVGNGAKLETLTIPSDTPDVLHGLIKSAARANEIMLGDALDFVVMQNIQG